MGIKDSRAFRDYVTGTRPPSTRTQNYFTWRATIPFTNDQVIAALRQLAATTENDNVFVAGRYRYNADYLERTGRLTPRVVFFVLPLLITACGICGKKALYRVGLHGRCSQHRLTPGAYAAARNKRLEEKSAAINATHRGRDYQQLSNQQIHTTAKFTKHKPRN